MLLGTYGRAQGGICDDPDAKALFKKDALRYLKRLSACLPGWTGAPHFNPAGSPVSGEATLHAASASRVGVFVEVDCGCPIPGVRSSPSGAQLLWRLEPLDDALDRWAPDYRNRWVHWDTPAQQLAALILAGNAQHTPLPKSA